VRVLFDQNTPAPLRQFLTQHEVTTAYELGWSRLKNGALLEAAEAAGIAALVTTDTTLRYQQNLVSRRIGIVVLPTTSWPRIQRVGERVVQAVDGVTPGSYIEVSIP